MVHSWHFGIFWWVDMARHGKTCQVGNRQGRILPGWDDIGTERGHPGIATWQLGIMWQYLSIPIGSMVLLYMVTWIPSIYPSHVSIYTSTMDPMGCVIYVIYFRTYVYRTHIHAKYYGSLWWTWRTCTFDLLGWKSTVLQWVQVQCVLRVLLSPHPQEKRMH